MNAAKVNEGKSLLSEFFDTCDMSVKFNETSEKAHLNSKSTINYTVNSTRAQKEVSQWFGPHFYDLPELEILVKEHQTLLQQNSGLKNLKRNIEICTLQTDTHCALVSHFTSFVFLLVSSHVPSSVVALIVSAGEKRGLYTRMLRRLSGNSTRLSSLGLSSSQAPLFGVTTNNEQDNVLSEEEAVGGFTLILFHGNSAALKLLGLSTKISAILTTDGTDESMTQWLSDSSLIFQASKNSNRSGTSHDNMPTIKRHGTIPQGDYFCLLYLNDRTIELIIDSTRLPPVFQAHAIYSKVFHSTGDLSTTPEKNMMAVVLRGKYVVDLFPALINRLIGSHWFDCIQCWKNSSMDSEAASLYRPYVELLGVKYFPNISNCFSFILAESLSKSQWSETLNNKKLDESGLLFVLRYLDKNNFRKVQKILMEFKSDLLASQCDIHLYQETSFILMLMMTCFYPHELQVDSCDFWHLQQTWPRYLPESHLLFNNIDANTILSINPGIMAKKTLPSVDWECQVNHQYLPQSQVVYQLHYKYLNVFTCQALPDEVSYCGLSILHDISLVRCITKCICFLVKEGFQIAAIKFPSVSIILTF